MKKIKENIVMLLCAVIFIGLFSSCEKELINYRGIEGIYFAVQHGSANGTENNWPYQPFSKVRFAAVQGQDTTIRLKVLTTGPIYAYDRNFEVEVNPDSTTAVMGKHFSAVKRHMTIPANSSKTYVEVKLHRTADLKQASKQIGLRLVPSDQLSLSFPQWDAIPGYTQSTDPIIQEFDAGLHTILLDDLLPKPTVWSGNVGADLVESGNWGEYSEKKMLLICEVMNLSYQDFSSTTTMPLIRVNLITREMSQYLQDRFEAGAPVLEADGRLMYIRGVSWTSKVGVPWQ